MAIIKSLNNKGNIINSLYPKKKIGCIDIYDRSTKGIVLGYFTIISKILNHYIGIIDNTVEEKNESVSFDNQFPLREINSSFIREPYKEKSFFEEMSFFLSTAKDVLRTSIIDSKVELINKIISVQ